MELKNRLKDLQSAIKNTGNATANMLPLADMLCRDALAMFLKSREIDVVNGVVMKPEKQNIYIFCSMANSLFPPEIRIILKGFRQMRNLYVHNVGAAPENCREYIDRIAAVIEWIIRISDGDEGGATQLLAQIKAANAAIMEGEQR